MLNIYIGFDSSEVVAYHVLANSIVRHSSKPVSITPVSLKHLSDVFIRENQGTTEFSLTRFLVPFLSGYFGLSIFMDCDMLLRTDIHEVLEHVNPIKAVSVCQHDYIPKTTTKATGAQTTYPRKNWSSFMVFNNSLCKKLTPEYVNIASPLDLHRLNWADSIGSIPLAWNHLVGEYDYDVNAKNVHFTLGTPCFEAYRNCDYSQEWHEEFARTIYHKIL